MTIATEVLLVDDNPGDTDLIADVLKRNDRHTRVHSVADGVEAMAFLRGEESMPMLCRPP
jgi:chemotaxis family two-component system response regulator Rcp1